MNTETFFLGSSTEGESYARAVLQALKREFPDVQTRAWWHQGIFRQGESFIESLERVSAAVTAAILVFSPDDDAEIREHSYNIPRDNVVFEYGLFVGTVGRLRVAVVQIDDAKLPSDLSGVTVMRLRSTASSDEFADDACEQLRRWLEALSESAPARQPLLSEQLKLLAPTFRAWPLRQQERFDRNAAQLVQTLFLSILTDSQSVNSAFVRLAEHELKDSISISAYDATGPAGWVGPAPYRYIASQVREYLFANRIRKRWQPFVHEWLNTALSRAITNAQEKMPGRQSATRFDDEGEIQFQVGVPRLQYSRTLVWTEEELADPLAEPVITLHEAFRIPLFFVPVAESAPEKRVAYVAFEKRNGPVSVLFGDREHSYDATRDSSFSQSGSIPGLGNALEMYKSLLQREDLMLALDARELLLGAQHR